MADSVIEAMSRFHDNYQRACVMQKLSAADKSIDQLTPNSLRVIMSFLLLELSTCSLSSATAAAELESLSSLVHRESYDLDRVKLLFQVALADQPDIEKFLDLVHSNCGDLSTPPPTTVSAVQQTPIRFTTDATAASLEQRRDMDLVLREEIGAVTIDLDIYGTFFKPIPGLDATAEVVFQSCCKGDNPLFDQGWRDWPNDTSEKHVLPFLINITQHLVHAAQSHMPKSIQQRLTDGLSQRVLEGSTAKRKIDIAFVRNDAEAVSTTDWSQIIVVGELKSSPSQDIRSGTWLDLAKYAREIFNVQGSRRFILGFTFCGSLMRIFEIDRSGVIGSTKVDINREGLQFVSIMLGFAFMEQEALGFDPTIIKLGYERYIEIEVQDQRKRLFLRKQISRARGVVTRGTTCWETYFKEEPEVSLLLKDSWQPIERNEGELLRLATEKGATNVARYYHSWTVQVGGLVDDVQNNIRKGLNIEKGEQSVMPNLSPGPCSHPSGDFSGSQDHGSAGRKRTSDQAGLAESSVTTRSKSAKTRSMSTKKQEPAHLKNRVHQRILMRDIGKPIFQAHSLAELLECLAQCVAGHKALYDVGILHRDISINNLMINQDRSDPSFLGFLIDLDHAVRIPREEASGAASRTGTRAFISIGVLFGHPHSFMDDLESFFWVLLWICVHFDDGGQPRPSSDNQIEKWSYVEDSHELARRKLGVIASEESLNFLLYKHCSPYHMPLIPCVRRLWKIIFPEKEHNKKKDERLYQKIQDVLREAKNDPGVKKT